MVFRRDDSVARVIVPDHKAIRVGTPRQILHDAGLTLDEFLRLLGRE
jgi:hypothetical protein